MTEVESHGLYKIGSDIEDWAKRGQAGDPFSSGPAILLTGWCPQPAVSITGEIVKGARDGVDPGEMEWGSAGAFCGPGAVHEGHDIVQMKVLSDRRSEGGGIAWLVRYSVHGHVGRPEYLHAVVASRIASLVPPRAPDPGDLSRGAIHRLGSEMFLIDKEETVYA